MAASSSDTFGTIARGLELTADDGVRLVSLTFGLTLYTERLFSQVSDSVLRCHDRFLQLCPPDRLRFHATGNMRRHKPVTKRSPGMLKGWLKPGAAPRKDYFLELKDGRAYQDAPEFKFKIAAGEPGSVMHEYRNANILSMAFPAEWGLERTDEMQKLVLDLCADFPFISGHAGFSFECSRYEAEESETFAWSQSMMHPGIDISRVPPDGKAVGHDAVKGVGWLTMLGVSLVEGLGGRKKLREAMSKDAELIDAPGGVVIKARPEPALGDTGRGDDLPSYRNVYRAVAPLIEIAAERSLSLTLARDYVERTEAWYRRFSSG
jgi:hypothetical protein